MIKELAFRFILLSVIFGTVIYVIFVYVRQKKGEIATINTAINTVWIALFFGVTLSALYFGGYALWQFKKFNDENKSFDETEYLKTHYQGVDCSSLSGRVSRDDISMHVQSICLAERAWFENNIKFCYQAGNPNDTCLTWMAIKLGDLKVCEMKKPYYDPDSYDSGLEGELLEEEKPRAWLYKCYWIYARMRDEPAVCDLIPFASESSKKIECIKPSMDGDTYLEFKNAPFW